MGDSEGNLTGAVEYAPFWVGIERPGEYDGLDAQHVTRAKKISKLRGEQIVKLLGWRWIYPEIQKCGYFGQSLEQVYNVGFRTAVHAMNLNFVTGR